MGISYNPSVAGDGLVFYYDMANTQKSWKGAPTTNLYTGAANIAGSVDGFGGGSFLDTNLISSNLFDNSIVYARKSNSGVATWSVEANLTAGVTYTYSIWCKAITQSSVSLRRNEPGVYIAEGKTVNVIEGQWTRVDFTFTVSAGKSGTQVIGIQVGDANIGQPNPGIFLYGAQLEQRSYSTPFVSGTRGDTQAILDLTGNNILTAGSLTYANDNTFSFNGSTNHLISTNFSMGADPVCSINMWIKRTSSFSNGGYWGLGGGTVNSGICGYTSVADKIGWDLWGQTTFHTGIDYPLNQWVNVCWVKLSTTFTTSTLKIYINGVDSPLTTTIRNNSSSVSLINGIAFGRLSTSVDLYYAPGLISNASVYNRALSATEVYNNFIALKSRYGL